MMDEIKKKMTEANLVQSSKLVTEIMWSDHDIKDKLEKNKKVKFSTNQNNYR
jgi:hypothetical protein